MRLDGEGDWSCGELSQGSLIHESEMIDFSIPYDLVYFRKSLTHNDIINRCKRNADLGLSTSKKAKGRSSRSSRSSADMHMFMVCTVP